MAGDYHGWDQEDGSNLWHFADVTGHPHSETVFVIDSVGDGTTARQALSAIMSAMSQFQGRVQVVQNDQNRPAIQKLKAASLLKVAPMTVGGQKQWGILEARSKVPQKSPWWKFW